MGSFKLRECNKSPFRQCITTHINFIHWWQLVQVLFKSYDENFYKIFEFTKLGALQVELHIRSYYMYKTCCIEI